MWVGGGVCLGGCVYVIARAQNRVFTLNRLWNAQTLVLITINPSSMSLYLKSYTTFINSAIHMLFPEDPLVMETRTEGNARSSCLVKRL